MKKYSLGLLFTALLILASCSQDNQLQEIEQMEAAMSLSTKTTPLEFSVTEQTLIGQAKAASFSCAMSTVVTRSKDRAGEIAVSRDDTTLYVKYMTRNNWVIDRTRLFVGDCALIPTTGSGNPSTSDFPYTANHTLGTNEVIYSIPLSDLNDCFCIVAYSIVTELDINGNQLRCDVAWSDGIPFGGTNEATMGKYCQTGCKKMENGPTRIR